MVALNIDFSSIDILIEAFTCKHYGKKFFLYLGILYLSTVERSGCPKIYIRMVRLLHGNMFASVLIDGESTESFKVKTGVKYGCVIAPALFSIFISAVLNLVSEKLPRGIDM